MKNALLLSLCVLATLVIKAETEFTGNVNNNWNNADNWTNGVPSDGNDAVIPEGLTAENNDVLQLDYYLSVFGTFNNYAELTSTAGATLFVHGTFNNFASFHIGGGMTVHGVAYLENDVVHDVQSVIIITGTICTNGTFTNNGESQIEGIWHNSGEIINNGNFLNAGYLFHCGNWTGLDPSDDWDPFGGQYIYEGCDDLPVCSEIMGFIVPGCTDETACNYNPLATIEDASCLPDLDEDGVCDDCDNWENIIVDCACEFIDPNTYQVTFIEVDEDECVIIENCYCECNNDIDGDGICDENEIGGCTDPESCNFTPDATDDDGSCSLVELYPISGETDPSLLETVTYSYTATEGSSYDWVCTGGTIQSGNGTSQVEIIWEQEFDSQICVVETNAEQCTGEQVCHEVFPMLVGILEREMINVVVFPNPSRESFSITLGKNLVNASYELFDLNGKSVRDGKIQGVDTIVRTEGLEAGIYTLRVTTNNLVASERVLLK